VVDLKQAVQQALAFTMRDFATVRDFEAARAVLHDTLKAALEQPERPNLLGWSFHRNSDGSIGIKAPPPKPGESQRTGESVYPTDGGGLHELLGKFVDHINALEQAEQTCNCRWIGDVQTQQCTLHEAHIAAIHEWAERAKAAEAKLKHSDQAEPVTWGVDWGREGDQPCCTITRRRADGTWETVAVEYGPPRREAEPAAFDALVAISLLTDLGGEVADYADVVDAVRRLHAVNQELLEALKSTRAFVNSVAPHGGLFERINAVIAKAEGKA
jgi:hypothetical protein